MRFKDVLRLILALLFFAGAIANAVILLTAPDIYEGFADLSFFRFYRTIWLGFILPRIGLWITLLVIFEIVTGVLLLASGRYAYFGLALAAGYTALLVPFWWGGGGIINILLFGVMVWLLRFPYPESIPALIFGR
jgi:hypothetical protein